MKSKQLLYKIEALRHLYFRGPLSCAELSDFTQKSLPLSAKVLNDLLEADAILETGLATSTGGRRPQTYQLSADLMYVVCVAMDQLLTRVTILDMHNNYVVPVEEFPLVLTNNPTALEQLGSILKSYIEVSGVDNKKIIGIGIGMPGFVDVHKGLNHSFLKPKQGSIISYLQQVTSLPVFIDNDSSLIALAESRFGEGRSVKNLMVVNSSWGVGLGMVLEGGLYRGDTGFAGEFSHIPLFTNGKICSCGKTGCLETEASLVVLIQKAQEGIAAGRSTAIRGIDGENSARSAAIIFQAARDGDRFAVELISEIGHTVGRGIAILIHILNPGKIVLSGRGAAAGNLWLAPIQQAINENCIPRIAEKTTVHVSKMGSHAELLGAAALVMEQLEQIDFPATDQLFTNVLSSANA